jgi:hypothetical protein
MSRFGASCQEALEVFQWKQPLQVWVLLRNTLPISITCRNRVATKETHVFCGDAYNIYIRERGVTAVSGAPSRSSFIAKDGVSLTPPETAVTPETGAAIPLYNGDR